jgi:P4 family phage/plasmid primase-like protien
MAEAQAAANAGSVGSAGPEKPEPVAVVADWLRAFAELGQVVELRALKCNRGYRPVTWAGYFDDQHLVAMAEEAVRLSPHAEGVYFTLNPLKPELLARRANRAAAAETGFSAGDKDVLRRRHLLIDADPIRVAGISATDAEKAEALEVHLAVCEFLRGRGWPALIRGDSGNGYHALAWIDLAADDEGLVQRVLQALAARFNTDRVKIDTSVYNPARICKLYGTLARKGDSTPDRPHRRAQLLEVPGWPDTRRGGDVVRECVPLELLQELAAEAPPPQAKTFHANGTAEGNGATTDDDFRHRLKVAEWLTARGVGFQPRPLPSGGTKYLLDSCPFNPDHRGKEVVIGQEPSGALWAKCLHDSCSGNRWQEFKAKIGKPDRDHWDPPLPKRGRKKRAAPPVGVGRTRPEAKEGAAEKPNEALDDPNRLARVYLVGPDRADFLAGGPVPDDLLKLRYWSETWCRWDGECYREVPQKEIRAELHTAIKQEFDRLNIEAIRWMKENGPKGGEDDGKGEGPPEVRKVTVKLVNDALQALSGITVLPSTLQPPAWISGPGPFPAAEMIATPNALVHLPNVVRRREQTTCPPTVDFLSFGCLDYDYVADAPEPKEWLAFLGKVWPDDQQAIDTLQEWFGYCLLPDTRQHKILLVVGPRRSGKGTIARVLRALIGLRNTAAPTLGSLGTNFGLWPLIGKTVAIISDARLSGRTDAAIVTERLLSISGEDAQTIDRKNLSQVTVKLPVRFMIMTNELPKLNDPSGALVGRMVVLQQTRSWYGHEDMSLTDRLLEELPGILRWAIEGWERLDERGYFVQPDSAKKLIADMEDLSSLIGAFIRERCDVGPGYEVLVRDLFETWKKWCEEKGHKDHGNEQTFGRDLRAAIPTLDVRQPRSEGGRVRVYVGIRLRVESGGPPP